MNGIEAMTRHALIRAGIPAEDLPRLVHHAIAGHGPSRRLLERAIGGEVFVTLPGNPGGVPIENADARHRNDGIVLALVRVGGLIWMDNTLSGNLPHTLAAALPGRRLREIIDAEFIPEDAVTRPTPGGLVEFDRIVIPTARTTALRRMTWLPGKWRLFLSEGVMDGPKPAWMLGTMGSLGVTTAALAAIKLTGPDWRGPWDWLGVAFLAAASLNGLWFVANGMRTRQFSLFHAWTAAARHRPKG